MWAICNKNQQYDIISISHTLHGKDAYEDLHKPIPRLHPWFMEGTDEEFTERYRAMLDSHGVARIRTELETISQLNGGKDIVLLCFDDVRKGLCHRTIFAQWWQEKTGEEVKELQKGLEAAQNVLF